MADTKETRTMTTSAGCSVAVTRVTSTFGDGISVRITQKTGESKEYAMTSADAVTFTDVLSELLGYWDDVQSPS